MPYLSIVAVGESGRCFEERLAGHGLDCEVIVCGREERNAAIFRARGEFILCTTTSIAFSDELVRFLAARQLQRNSLYRINRHDVEKGRVVRTWTPHGIFTDPPSSVPIDRAVQFGAGWFEYERDATGRFWWMTDEAELRLAAPDGGIVLLEVEPGPCAATPQPLELLDSAGTKLTESIIRGRDLLRIVVPPRTSGIRLRAPATAAPLPHDPRALRLRLHHCEWHRPDVVAPQPQLSERPLLMRLARAGKMLSIGKARRLMRLRRSDIFDSAIEFDMGPGWEKLEVEAGSGFRWAQPKAALGFFFDDGSSRLALLVEPGPALGFQPFDLVVRTPDGKVAASARVNGLSYVELPLPIQSGRRIEIVLCAEGAGAAGSAGERSDPRILAFRVWACGRVAKRTIKPTNPAHDAWAIHTVRSSPAEEFRYPDPLHLFACGDFQLMAREHWLDLRGYPEFERPSAHVDALLSQAAREIGVQEEILTDPLRIKHIEPDSVSTESPRDDYLTLADCADLAAEMKLWQAPIIISQRHQPEIVQAAGQPYISVVVGARNDNHGGDMLVRMKAFLDSWIGLAKRYQLPSEIIVVEWNPPADRGRLQDEFSWTESTAPCTVRFIEVSREVHASIPNHETVRFHQMIAKNVGIRRARGQFVLATNLDIVFSPELMEYLATRPLDPQVMYRMDRTDIANQIPPGAGLDELIAYCRSNVIRIVAHEGAYDTGGARIRPVEADDLVAPGSGLRLGSGWHGLEHFAEGDHVRYFDPGAEVVFEGAGGREVLLDVELGPSAPAGGLDLEVANWSVHLHGRHHLRLTVPADAGGFALRVRNGGVALVQDFRLLDLLVFSIHWGDASAARDWNLEIVSSRPARDWSKGTLLPSPYAAQMRNPAFLHANACGDFTMLSREAWFAVRGYPEFPIWPTHLDSITCYSAYHAGFREVVLGDPMRIFHIDHAAIWTPEGEDERAARAKKMGIDLFRYATLIKHVHYMRRFNAPFIYTREKWGLADRELPESTPANADRRA
jgi:hypothetical protein